MSNNLFQLVRIEVLKFLSSFNSKGKKASRTPLFYLVLLVGVLIIGASVGYTYMIADPFVKLGLNTTPVLTMFASLTSLLIFMTSLSQSRSIYIGEDYDMLSALPFKKRTIVASKIITLYITEVSFSLLIMIPHGIFMFAYANNLTAFLFSLLLSVTIPIVPIAISVIISLLITIATAKFKFANYIFVGLYALVIVGFSVLSMIVNNLKEASAAEAFTSTGNILKWINPSYYLIELSLSQSVYYLIAFVGVNIVVAILTVLFLSLLFDDLHDIVSSAGIKSKYVRKHLKVKSADKTLAELEFKRLASSKLYFVNSIIGSLMCIMASVMLLVSYSQSINSTMSKPEVTEETIVFMKSLLIPMFVAVDMLVIGLTNPSTGSINIEGKNFWMIKTLPINYKTYLKTKIRFSLILTIPACIIAAVIATIFKHDDWIEIVASFIVPMIYVILNTIIGMLVAIKHPKLKWNSEAEAVKNAASVFIALLIHTAIVIPFVVVFVIVPIFIPRYYWLSYVIVGGASFMPIIPLGIYLNKTFSKRIQAMEDF